MEAAAHPRVLLVEDAPDLAMLYRDYLRDEPVDLEYVETGRAALARIEEAPPQVLLLDLKLPDIDGREVLDHIVAANLPTSVVVMTAHGSIDVAVQAMQAGARDFLTKPIAADRLRHTLRKSLREPRRSLGAGTKKGAKDGTDFEGFVGLSSAMKAVYRSIDSAAHSQAAVFISGETGTGKELCAQAIHRRSNRHSKPFVALNCSAIPKELMESEIFGHVKGAYTGALRARSGAAKRADGGTLFLDEICEMEAALQAKLLRFLQSGNFIPLGSDRSETVDVRLICATNRDPLQEIAAGRCREDLYYRIHVVPIHLLPLRERQQDILPVARHYLATFAQEEDKAFRSFAPEVETAFEDYAWPGNVRQLMNVIRTITVLHEGRTVTAAMLPPLDPTLQAHQWSIDPEPAIAVDANGTIKPLRRMEQELIEDAIARCGGNVVEAAKMLEISPSTIYRKRSAWNDGTNA